VLTRVLGKFALQDISIEAADAHAALARQDHAAKDFPAKHRHSNNDQ
jgi:hypothetical protein